jgi:hypothetical protein
MLVRATVLTAAAGLALVCAGCSSASTTQVLGSRAELYGSLADLAAASDEIVAVSVVEQQPSGAADSIAVSTVLDVLGDDGALRPGDSVEVRQLGGAGTPTSVEQPLLEPGRQYLLFLTPTDLPGEEADQYYVVGVSAGVYAPVAPIDAPVGADTEFVHVGPIEGDRIPERFRVGDLP